MSFFEFPLCTSLSATKIFTRIAFCAALGCVTMQANAQLEVANGSPVYTVPIVVPPGIGGMVPQLQLEFNAGGSVGAGWAIKGISQIARCPSSKLIDGVNRGVDFSPSDRLCLDGQRLIQTDENGVAKSTQTDDSLGGSDGNSVREYRTATDSFARIRAYSAANGNAVNGPAYFKVWTKDGQIIEYGNNSNATANAQITVQGQASVTAWPVSRIADLTGNFIDFDYSQRDLASGSPVGGVVVPGREWSLKEVRYTGRAGQDPVNKVVFEYVERTGLDRSEAYHNGAKTVGVWMLSKVKTYAGAIPVKTLKLGYEIGPVSQRSRPKSVVECAGDSASCLPSTTFNYKPDTPANYSVSQTFQATQLAGSELFDNRNGSGTIAGNFAGSGRTDLIRWGDTPGINELWINNADGTFTRTGSGILSFMLGSSSGCYSSIANDFNGDGLTDILTIMKPTGVGGMACGTVVNRLHLATGQGRFESTVVNIDFTQKLARVTEHMGCRSDQMMMMSASTTNMTTSGTTATSVTGAPIPANHILGSPSTETTAITSPRSKLPLGDEAYAPALQQCVNGDYGPDGMTSRTAGRTFHFVDANNDGLIDVFTTDLPAYSLTYTPPDDSTLCLGKVCTRLYLQQPGGVFAEGSTNLSARSLYSDPPTTATAYWRQPNLADINGDKLVDLIVDSGVWVARGDGNYDSKAPPGFVQGCNYPLDFNGDNRIDCLPTMFGEATYQSMYVADGVSMRPLSNFNLRSPGQELLKLTPDLLSQTVGVETGDVNGDGRSDIIRWKDNSWENAVYLSNGDGTFSTAPNALGLAGVQLQKSDGTYRFLTGDFSGNGGIDILRMRNTSTPAPAGSNEPRNVLYVKGPATPPDQLASLTTGTGLTASLTWVPLSNSKAIAYGNRYSSDRLKPEVAAIYPAVDLTAPMFVVATVNTDTPTGNMKQTVEYSYAGLKGAHDGRGMLGFRETRTQTTAPNGEPLMEVTQYLQTGPYIGKPSVHEIRRGALDSVSPSVLSRTTNIYCDIAAPVASALAATKDNPCVFNTKIQRPYLYKSVAEAWDLNNKPLPVTTTTNTLNENGDPLQVVTSRSGAPEGLSSQASSRTLTNVYCPKNTADCPNNTAGDSWLLSRVQRSTVSGSVQNSIDGILTTAPPPLPPPAPQVIPPAPVSLWLPAVLSILLESD